MTIDAYDTMFKLNIAHRTAQSAGRASQPTLYSDAVSLIAQYRSALVRIRELGERHAEAATGKRLHDFRQAIEIAHGAIEGTALETSPAPSASDAINQFVKDIIHDMNRRDASVIETTVNQSTPIPETYPPGLSRCVHGVIVGAGYVCGKCYRDGGQL